MPELTPAPQLTEGNTTVIPMVPTKIQPATEVLPLEASPPGYDEKGITEVLQGITEVLHDHAGFDATRYYLGKLCPQGHAYQDTDKSLLRRSNQRCWECDKAMKRAIKARQKAARQEGTANATTHALP
jgi:hypothetical protein